MPQSLDERIAEIRGRLEKATPGEWYQQDTSGPDTDLSGYALITIEDKDCQKIARTFGLKEVSNAHFIAHAPSDIRFLLDAFKREREECAKMASDEAQKHKFTQGYDALQRLARAIRARGETP